MHGLGCILGDFFAISSGHPATKPSVQGDSLTFWKEASDLISFRRCQLAIKCENRKLRFVLKKSADQVLNYFSPGSENQAELQGCQIFLGPNIPNFGKI
jgi:hypothetical protein